MWSVGLTSPQALQTESAMFMAVKVRQVNPLYYHQPQTPALVTLCSPRFPPCRTGQQLLELSEEPLMRKQYLP